MGRSAPFGGGGDTPLSPLRWEWWDGANIELLDALLGRSSPERVGGVINPLFSLAMGAVGKR